LFDFSLEGEVSKYFLHCVKGKYLAFRSTCFICNYIQPGTTGLLERNIKVRWYFAAMKYWNTF